MKVLVQSLHFIKYYDVTLTLAGYANNLQISLLLLLPYDYSVQLVATHCIHHLFKKVRHCFGL